MKYVNVGGRDRETDYQIDKLGEDNQIDNDGDDQLFWIPQKGGYMVRPPRQFI